MHDEKETSEISEVDDEIEIEFIDEETGLAIVEKQPTGLETTGETTDDEVGRLRKELDSVRDIYLRKLAEFDNFRKRTERERDEYRISASEDLVKELLPVLDNFERALQHEGDESGSFREGVEMIAKQLWDILDRQGLEGVMPDGSAFDPELHEAVQRVETDKVPPGIVVWTMIKGYLFKGRLIRPAMVGVSVEPQADGPAPNSVPIDRANERADS